MNIWASIIHCKVEWNDWDLNCAVQGHVKITGINDCCNSGAVVAMFAVMMALLGINWHQQILQQYLFSFQKSGPQICSLYLENTLIAAWCMSPNNRQHGNNLKASSQWPLTRISNHNFKKLLKLRQSDNRFLSTTLVSNKHKNMQNYAGFKK